jgi:hypothetical protein
MAVPVAAVIKNVCLSRHWKAEHVTRVQTAACVTLLVAQKPDQEPVCPVCPVL